MTNDVPEEQGPVPDESTLAKARDAERLHRRLQGQGGDVDREAPAARERARAVDDASEDAEASARRGRAKQQDG